MARQNKYHILRENHKLNMQEKFLFFDTEARIKKGVKEDIQTLRLGWACLWDRKTNLEEWFYFDKGASFWDFVEKNAEDGLMIYAHNTEYDFKVSNGYNELLIKRGWTIKNLHIQGAVFILTLEKDEKTIRLLDTMNYSTMSLEKIGKEIGVKKINLDRYKDKEDNIRFNDVPDAKLSDYCRNDVLIIRKFIEYLIDFLEENDLSRLKSTAGAIALNTFRHKFYSEDNPVHIHAQEEAVKLERKSYKGGITDCFKVGQYRQRLHKLDINSMYPFVCKKYEYPVKLLYFELECKQDYKLVMDSRYHYIIDTDIELPPERAYILTDARIGLTIKSVFICGPFRTQICTPEIEYVLRYGKINRVYSIAVYEKREIFGEFVDFFYDKRREYDAKGQGAFALFCKMMLNTLYGKFGQKQSNITELSDKMNPGVGKYHFIDGCGGKNEQYVLIHLGNKLFRQEVNESNAYDSFVAISSMITSYARIYLVELISVAGRDNCFYCDTDSLVVNDEGLKRLRDYIDIDKKNKQLGKLKYEEESLDSTFIRPKFYDFNGSLKCKGVRKKHKTLSDNEEKWVVLQDQFVRYKSALESGKIDCQVVKHIKKKISKNYDKGLVREGIVYPYSISDIEYLNGLKKGRKEYERQLGINELEDIQYIDSTLEDGQERDIKREIGAIY